MRKQLQGIGLILFGMLLVTISAVNKNWVPMMSWGISGAFSFILIWLGLIVGIIGLVFLFQNDNINRG